MPGRSQRERSGSIDRKLPKPAAPVRRALRPAPAPRPAPAAPQSAPGGHPPSGARCGAVRRDALARRPALRAPYLHQLPPVLPRNSFFSEFQMNFFQPPSSLAFPRAMVAAQQRLPRGCVRGTAARALLRSAPAGVCAAAPAAAAAALRVPGAPRRSGSGRARGGRRRGRREEGGAEGPRAARLRAPHLSAGTRPLTGSLWSTTRSSCPWRSSGASPAASGSANGAPASGDLC